MARIVSARSNVVLQTVQPAPPPPPPPPQTFLLELTSLPSTTFTLDGVGKSTPFVEEVSGGSHTIAFPTGLTVENMGYSFGAWSDGVQTPTRTLDVVSDTTLSASYLSPVGLVTLNANRAILTFATRGGRKFIRDSFGKYLAFLTSPADKLGVFVNNGDPAVRGWLPPFRWTSGPDIIRPAIVMMSPNEARAVTADSGIIDAPITFSRDAAGNITGVAFGPATTIDTTGNYPSAIRAHDGSIWAVYSRRTTVLDVVAARWTPSGGWTKQVILTDPDPSTPVFPVIFERLDNFRLYVVANRDPQTSRTHLLFNSANFSGGSWTWGTGQLIWKTDVSRGAQDAPDIVWDAGRGLAVIMHDQSGDNNYVLRGLDAQDNETNLNTPVFEISNNEWGALAIDAVGDYYIAMLDGGVSGRIGWGVRRGGVWQTALIEVDGDNNNLGIQGLQDRPEILYGKAASVGVDSPPLQVRYARLS